MRLLLDTHLLIWAASEPARLPAKARMLMKDETNQLFFSAASIWEIAIKASYKRPDFVVDITPYVDKKIEALQAFKTQFFDPNSNEPKTPISGKEYFDFLKGRWMDFGRSIGVQYAEGFNVSRPVGVEDLTGLL